MKGFSPRNLKYMRAFAEAWPDGSFVQEVLAQLLWYHQLALLDKLPGPKTRQWYAAKAIEHNWSRNVLVMQIEIRLLERSGKAAKNFDLTLPKPQSDLAQQSLKDPLQAGFPYSGTRSGRARHRRHIGQACHGSVHQRRRPKPAPSAGGGRDDLAEQVGNCQTVPCRHIKQVNHARSS